MFRPKSSQRASVAGSRSRSSAIVIETSSKSAATSASRAVLVTVCSPVHVLMSGKALWRLMNPHAGWNKQPRAEAFKASSCARFFF